jgi:hypothetical protein
MSKIDTDKILVEWAYRCQKGYPDMDNPSDLRILKQILKENNVEFPNLIVEQEEEKKHSPRMISLILSIHPNLHHLNLNESMMLLMGLLQKKPLMIT